MAVANYGLGLSSPVASGGVAHILDTTTAYGAGKLLSLRTNAVEKFSVDYTGAIAGTGASITALSATNVTAGNLPYAQLPTGTGAWDTGVGTTITVTRSLTVSGTLTGTLTGSASTLTTPRTINGVSFNGSANITVTAAAGTLTGDTLAATVVTSSLTTVGALVGGAVPATLLTGTLAYALLPVGSDTWDIGLGNKLTFVRQVELLATGTLAVGVNAYGLLVGLTYTTAASGTHALIAGVRISSPVLTDGGAAVTDAATLYIAGEPGLGTNRYALRVVAGNVSFGGMLHAVGGITIGANVARAIGTSSTNISGGTATNSGGNIIVYGGAHATSPGAVQIRNDGVTVALFQGAVATITGLLAVSAGASFRTSALAVGATTGHVMIPTSAGAPTGVPSTIPTGQAAFQYDSTNHKLYVYSGAWRSNFELPTPTANRVLVADGVNVSFTTLPYGALPTGAPTAWDTGAGNTLTITRAVAVNDTLAVGTAATVAGTLRVGAAAITAGAGIEYNLATGAGDSASIYGNGPAVVRVLSTATSAAWGTSPWGMFDFRSADATGAGAVVRAAVGAYMTAADGGATGLKFYVAPTGGLTLALTIGSDLSATFVGAFGCNGATARTAAASGGALGAYVTGAFGLDTGANMSALHALVVAMRAALVNNGIMS